MKRNSMLTKIIAVLLCALMAAAWLPKTSAAANDFESGMDRIYGTDAANAMPLVIGTNADSGLANAYYAYTPAEDGTLTLTAEDGTTFTVDGVAYTDAVAVTAGTKYIIVATNAAKNHSFTAAFEVAPTGPVYDPGLGFDNLAMNLAGYIGAQFSVDSRYIAEKGYTDIYVVVNLNGKETELRTNIGKDAVDADGNPRFVYEYRMAASQMGMTLTVTAHAKLDGVDCVGVPTEWSLKQGILARLETYYPRMSSTNPTTAATAVKRCTLFVDMMYYGAEAERLFNSATEDQVITADLDPKYVALRTTTTPAINDVNDAVSSGTYAMTRLALGIESTVQLQPRFYLPDTNYEKYQVYVTYTNAKGSYEYTYGAVDFSPNSTNPKYVTVAIDFLASAQMRDMITIQLQEKNSDGVFVNVGKEYRASIEGGCYARLSAESTAPLVTALMIYADSAKAVFG